MVECSQYLHGGHCLWYSANTKEMCSEGLVFPFAPKGPHIKVLNFTLKVCCPVKLKCEVLIGLSTTEPWTVLYLL